MFDIHRMYLSIMQEKGLIEKVASGIYIDTNKIEDNYYVFGLSMPNVIYSHMTALYFHGLSIKAPNDVYDITVKRSYNSVHLRKHNVFYVDNDIYEIGLTEIETPMGNKVKVYDNGKKKFSSRVTIKGRGNHSWTLPKKPYQLSFDAYC